MALTLHEQLRLLLGEEIPDTGLDSDTMFTDDRIEHFLSQGHGIVEQAAFHGWVAKMNALANLVTVNEGNAAREMTELHKNAKRMVDFWSGYVSTPSRGRARIGRIRRRTEAETS